MLLFQLLFHLLFSHVIRGFVHLVKQYPCGVVAFVFSFAMFSPKLPQVSGLDIWPWVGVAVFTVGGCMLDRRRKRRRGSLRRGSHGAARFRA
jgi:hypothetical protein